MIEASHPHKYIFMAILFPSFFFFFFTKGLKLKQKSQKLPFRAFDYTPAINYSADLGPTDWHLLSVYDIVGDHIRVHELREGDNLLEYAKEYWENHAQAMIVINSTEDSSLLSELSQSLRELVIKLFSSHFTTF